MRQITAEGVRLEQDRKGEVGWRRWVPTLPSPRWGPSGKTKVPTGRPWTYLPQITPWGAPYRWVKVGLGGFPEVNKIYGPRWAP